MEGASYADVRAGEGRAGGGQNRRRKEGRTREADPGADQHLRKLLW